MGLSHVGPVVGQDRSEHHSGNVPISPPPSVVFIPYQVRIRTKKVLLLAALTFLYH